MRNLARIEGLNSLVGGNAARTGIRTTEETT
jgi:hypothetical protein